MEQISRRRVLTVGGLAGAVALTGCADEDEPSLSDTPSTTYHSADDGDSATSSEGSGDTGTSSPAGLTEVALDPPEELQNRWAAYAAAWTAVDAGGGGDSGPRVEGRDWIYEMEVGEWAWLVRFSDGRAVLVGQGNPDERRDAAQEKKARAALVAGAPSWWRTYEDVVPEFNSVGFVLGWDGKKWQRAGDAGGGFDALTFYPKSAALLGERLAQWGSEGESGYSGQARVAADRVMKAGAKVTATQLKALGPGIDDKRLKDGVEAAKAFRGKGRH